MPFGIHKNSNRSKQAWNDPAVQGAAPSPSGGSASPIIPSGPDEARTTQPQAFIPQAPAEAPPYAAQSSLAEFEQRTYPNTGELPARSQSTRYTSPYTQQGPFPPAGSSADDLALDPRKQQQGRRNAGQATNVEQKKSKSIFDRMRAGSNRAPEQKPSAPQQSLYNNTPGLSRRLSRRLEVSPSRSSAQQGNSAEHQQRDWQPTQDSPSQLPSPQEDVEGHSGLDPYLITRPEVEELHNTGPEQGQQQTIRAVQSVSDPPTYATNEDPRQQIQVPQQHSLTQVQLQQPESASQLHYQQPIQGHFQQQVNPYPGSLLINDQSRTHQNAETVSQLSYESPVDQRDEQRPNSVQSNGQSPTGNYTLQRQDHPARSSSIQGQRPSSQQTSMAPPGGTSQQNRRPTDTKPNLQIMQGQNEARDAPPPSYRQQFSGTQAPAPGLSPLPQAAGTQGPNYRGGPPQRDQYGPAGSGELGRSTPPPAPGDRDVNDAYKELLQKYKKVKGLYFEKTSQVEQLQNTLANQRLSQSRTSLDDSEYMTRFQRLDGAITNLAFNIRKDWRVLPNWLTQYVNQDALKIGKQEMTAVGRACLSRFLVGEVFNRTFHPGLELELSMNLKSVEQNIRRFSPALNNQEESDALTAKVVQWRLATLEGLKDILNSAESDECRKQFTQVATTNLAASLLNFLQESAPPGIEDSAHMIVELAVSIASNLPLESRDISIVYPMPGDILQPYIMKVETGIPPLENPGVETSSEVDATSTGSTEKDDTSKEAEKGDGKGRKEKVKSAGMLQAMIGGVSTSTGKKMSISSQGGIDVAAEIKSKGPMEDGAQKVRLAGFVGVEVRGRQVLCKAPVWTLN